MAKDLKTRIHLHMFGYGKQILASCLQNDNLPVIAISAETY